MPAKDQAAYMRDYRQRRKTGGLAVAQTVADINPDDPSDKDLSKVWDQLEEVPMDDIAKKAIEPERVKPEPKGRLSKGLGELPGKKVDPSMAGAWSRSKPSPKK